MQTEYQERPKRGFDQERQPAEEREVPEHHVLHEERIRSENIMGDG